jgi:hypothetical protein
MTWEKIIRRFPWVNLLAIGLYSWLAAFVFLFSLKDLAEGNFFSAGLIATYGYLIALIFGILTLKKKYFIWLSLVGWLCIWWGNHLDGIHAHDENIRYCLELREDTHCIEKENGTLSCDTGPHAGVYPLICKGAK